MKPLRHIVGAACELLTLRDPYDKPAPPKPERVLWSGSARSYQEAAKHAEGLTIEGNVSIAIVHTGRDRWEIRVRDWET